MNPLAALLGHGGPPPGPPGGGLTGPLPGQPAAPQGGGGSATQLLNQIIQLCAQFQNLPDERADTQDQADMAKILSTLRGIKLREQQETDSAIGAGPAVKMLRRKNSGY